MYWRDQDYAHKSWCVLMTVGTSTWTETCEIHEQDSPSLRYEMRNFLLKDICGPGRRLTKIQATTRPGLKFGQECQKLLRRRKNKNGRAKNQSLTMLENWEVFTSSIRKMECTRNPSKNARKMEVPVEGAMPCKMGTRMRSRELQETAARRITESNRKTKYACIVQAHESTRKRLESTLPGNREDHIAEKGLSSANHFNVMHKFIPMPQAMKILDAKAAVDKEWEKLQNLLAWKLDKVKSKKSVILEAQKEKKKVHFATLPHWWTSVISRLRS